MPLDDDDIATLTKLFEAKLAPVVQTQTTLTEQLAAQAKALKTAQEAAKTQAQTQDAARTQAQGAAGQKAEDQTGGKAKTNDDAARVLEAKLAAIQTQLAESEANAKAAEDARKKDKLKMDVRHAIGQHFPAEVVDNVIARLEYDGRITVTDAGTPAILYKRPFGDDAVPLEAALIEYRNSDEGKTFLPARGLSGTGDSIRAADSPLPLTQNKEVDWTRLKSQVAGRGGVTFGE